MVHVPMFRHTLIVLVGLVVAAPVSAATWAEALFDELAKDFGSVQHGTLLTNKFRITNSTKGSVRIGGTRVSCGLCITATLGQLTLAPGESTTLTATMDSRRFLGPKTHYVYVTFAEPQFEEVRVTLQANSRNDLAVAPEALAFGDVKRGGAPELVANVTFYGGSWKILEVERESNYILVAVKETRRTTTEAAYQVTASLRADLPVGRWYTDLWLKTDNPSIPKIRLPLTVSVEPGLSVTPGEAAFGTVKPGEAAERKVIVRGVKPFKITGIKGEDETLTVKDADDASKALHVLTLTYKPKAPGELRRAIRVQTDLADEGVLEFQAKGEAKP